MIKGEKFKKVLEEMDIADYGQFLALLKFRRSIRGFRDETVPDELIHKILEAGRWAPSAGNAQPWEFVVIKDKGTIQKLTELFEFQRVEKKWLESTRERKMQMYPGEQVPGIDKEGIFEQFKKDLNGKTPFRHASHMIVPLADERWQHAFPIRTSLDKGPQHIIGSLANAVFAMHLAAASMKLATQWVSDFGSPWLSGMTGNMLGIPRHCRIYEVMAVGYPSYYPKPRYVKPLEEVVHYEKYDQGKKRTEEEICEVIATRVRPGLKFKG